MIAICAIWPFEFLKNQIQADSINGSISIRQRLKLINDTHGRFGIMRGIIAGTSSVFIRNGLAMVVMQATQKKFTQLGFRE